MYEIEFYEDKNGKSEITDYIRELNRKASSSKESRVTSTESLPILIYWKSSVQGLASLLQNI